MQSFCAPARNDFVARRGFEMALTMKSVLSSNVKELGHDPETGELHVMYHNGKVSIYSGVPAEVHADVFGAPSIGSALHHLVKGKFPHAYK